MTIVHLIFLLTFTSINAESLKAKEKKHDFSPRNDARIRNSQEWKRSHKTLNFGKHVSSKNLRSNNLPKFQREDKEVIVTVKQAHTCPSDWAGPNDTFAEVYINIDGQQIMCGKTRQVRSQNPVFDQRVSCGKWEFSAIRKGLRIGFKLTDADGFTNHDRLGGLSFDKSVSEEELRLIKNVWDLKSKTLGLEKGYNGSFKLEGQYDCNRYKFKKSTVRYLVSLN